MPLEKIEAKVVALEMQLKVDAKHAKLLELLKKVREQEGNSLCPQSSLVVNKDSFDEFQQSAKKVDYSCSTMMTLWGGLVVLRSILTIKEPHMR